MVLRMYVAWRLAQAEEVRRKAVLEPRAQRLGSSPVASVAEDVRIIGNWVLEGVFHYRADESESAVCVPRCRGSNITLHSALYLLVQRLYFVLVVAEDDASTWETFNVELERLGGMRDEDHLFLRISPMPTSR